ncbi:MAG: hypothetical protein JOY60_10940 [Burkholderiaceae bacterium]|nr:hypothetical protein [Burkholderiaceae bacterium]
MLKVTLHTAPPDKANAFNLVGRLEIGYAKLAAIADYKVAMLATGLGEVSPARVQNYPRWSASIWDLVARAVCISLNRQESIWPTDIPVRRKGAYAVHLSAIVEHWPDGLGNKRSTIATAHIQMRRRRCSYVARFEDDLMGESVSDVFVHTPEVLMPWDLFARAYAWTFNGKLELPKRPPLAVPLPFEYAGGSYVLLDTLPEPSRSGIRRWLVRQNLVPTTVETFEGDCVTERQFVQFLETAV